MSARVRENGTADTPTLRDHLRDRQDATRGLRLERLALRRAGEAARGLC